MLNLSKGSLLNMDNSVKNVKKIHNRQLHKKFLKISGKLISDAIFTGNNPLKVYPNFT